MEQSIGSLENGRREDFSHRNIDICCTVLKICFLGGISGFIQFYPQIRPVSVSAPDLHKTRRIQDIDHPALDLLVQAAVKCIDLYDSIKDLSVFLVSFRDGGKRKIDDRKASVFSNDCIAVELSCFNIVIRADFLLRLIVARRMRSLCRTERSASESLQNSRPRI